MSKIDIKVEGVEKLIANLKKWQVVKRQAVEDIGKETGYKIEKAAKDKTAVPILTGRLRASLSTNWAGSNMPRGKVDTAAGDNDGVGQPEGPKGLVTVVGSNVAYAHMQEFGTWGDAPKPVGPMIGMPDRREEEAKLGPRPEGGYQFLTRAFVTNRDEYVRRIEEALKKDEHLK